MTKETVNKFTANGKTVAFMTYCAKCAKCAKHLVAARRWSTNRHGPQRRISRGDICFSRAVWRGMLVFSSTLPKVDRRTSHPGGRLCHLAHHAPAAPAAHPDLEAESADL